MAEAGAVTPRELTLRLLTGALPSVAAAVLGGAASGGARSPWYRSLRKPAIQPPRQAFPIVWSALYAETALCGTTVQARLSPRERRNFRIALAANMALNAGWSTFATVLSAAVRRANPGR